MTPRRAAFTAPFRWLIDAIDVGRHQPQVVIGAVAATALIGLLPSLPQQVMVMAGSTPNLATTLLFQALSVVFGLLVIPVLRAGIYRILDGAERGQPVHVGQVFEGFSDGSYPRLVGVSVLSMLLFFVLLTVVAVLIAVLIGVEGATALQAWMERFVALSEQAEAGKPFTPEQLPEMPPGLGVVMAVLLAFLPLGLLLGIASAWALVSVALRGASPVEAMVGALRAALLNAGAILALALALALPVLLLGGLVMLVLGAAMALFSMISPALGGAVMMLLMLGLGILLAAITYGFVLNGWRATCDAPEAARSDPPPTAPVAGFEA